MRRTHSRTMAISLFLIAISIFNFMNLKGNENVDAIHIISLLVCGMGIGIFLVSLFGMLRSKK